MDCRVKRHVRSATGQTRRRGGKSGCPLAGRGVMEKVWPPTGRTRANPTSHRPNLRHGWNPVTHGPALAMWRKSGHPRPGRAKSDRWRAGLRHVSCRQQVWPTTMRRCVKKWNFVATGAIFVMNICNSAICPQKKSLHGRADGRY